MLTVYLVSIVAYAIFMGWSTKISVDGGETITIGNFFWGFVCAFIPVIQQLGVIFSLVMIYDHYSNKPLFGPEAKE